MKNGNGNSLPNLSEVKNPTEYFYVLHSFLTSLKKDIDFLKVELSEIKKGISKLSEIEKSIIKNEKDVLNIMHRVELITNDVKENSAKISELNNKIQTLEQKIANIEKSKDTYGSIIKQIAVSIITFLVVTLIYVAAEHLTKTK